MKSVKILGITGLLGLLTMSSLACGNSDNNAQPGTQPPQQDTLTLANSDLSLIDSISTLGPVMVDARNHQIFSKIFGGTTGVEVRAFFDARVHHMVDLAKASVSPSQFASEKWLTPPAPSSPAPAPTSPPDGANNNPKAGLKIGALNIGSALWLEGLINQVSVVMQLDGVAVPLESSRTGIISFGEGYAAEETLSDGRVIPLPAEMRQSILLHEARHSDCTGGINDALIADLQNMTDSEATEKKYPNFTCAHLHRTCTGGDFKGLPICDNEAFGAYTVGAVYALASYGSAPEGLNQRIMKLLFVDQISRVQVDIEKLFGGELGDPDMSHTGYAH